MASASLFEIPIQGAVGFNVECCPTIQSVPYCYSELWLSSEYRLKPGRYILFCPGFPLSLHVSVQVAEEIIEVVSVQGFMLCLVLLSEKRQPGPLNFRFQICTGNE